MNNESCGTCYTVKTPGRKEGSRGNIHKMDFPEVEIVHKGGGSGGSKMTGNVRTPGGPKEGVSGKHKP